MHMNAAIRPKGPGLQREGKSNLPQVLLRGLPIPQPDRQPRLVRPAAADMPRGSQAPTGQAVLYVLDEWCCALQGVCNLSRMPLNKGQMLKSQLIPQRASLAHANAHSDRSCSASHVCKHLQELLHQMQLVLQVI